MIHFSVLLTTYNRPKLLVHTLKSLSVQSNKHFTVHLFDNGSLPPVNLGNLPSNIDMQFTRLENNILAVDVVNEGLRRIEGSHMLWLADDDALVPRALETVADYFQKYPEIEALGAGVSKFDHETCQPLSDLNYFNKFSGELFSFDGYQSGLKYCNSWYIGKNLEYSLPRMAHPSASFFSVNLITFSLSLYVGIIIKVFISSGGTIGLLF